jgi:hypothetical protein
MGRVLFASAHLEGPALELPSPTHRGAAFSALQSATTRLVRQAKGPDSLVIDLEGSGEVLLHLSLGADDAEVLSQLLHDAAGHLRMLHADDSLVVRS